MSIAPNRHRSHAPDTRAAVVPVPVVHGAATAASPLGVAQAACGAPTRAPPEYSPRASPIRHAKARTPRQLPGRSIRGRLTPRAGVAVDVTYGRRSRRGDPDARAGSPPVWACHRILAVPWGPSSGDSMRRSPLRVRGGGGPRVCGHGRARLGRPHALTVVGAVSRVDRATRRLSHVGPYCVGHRRLVLACVPGSRRCRRGGGRATGPADRGGDHDRVQSDRGVQRPPGYGVLPDRGPPGAAESRGPALVARPAVPARSVRPGLRPGRQQALRGRR